MILIRAFDVMVFRAISNDQCGWSPRKDGKPGLFSDGPTEAMNDRNLQFGEETVYEIVKSKRHLVAQELQRTILTSVEEFRGTAEQNDDLTLVLKSDIETNLHQSFTQRVKCFAGNQSGSWVEQGCRLADLIGGSCFFTLLVESSMRALTVYVGIRLVVVLLHFETTSYIQPTTSVVTEYIIEHRRP